MRNCNREGAFVAVPSRSGCDLSDKAYGAINSLLAIPATIAKAISPFGIALLWAATGSYNSVLVAALASSTLVVAGFWFAAAQSNPNKRPDAVQG